jgi:signal transduction histidine kinase
VAATSAQSEIDTLLAAHASALHAFGDVLEASYLVPEQKERAAASLFEANPGLVAITARGPDGSPLTLYDRNALTELGLAEDDVTAVLPAVPEAGATGSQRGISALEVPPGGRGRIVRVTLTNPAPLVGDFRAAGLAAALERVRTFGAVLEGPDQSVLLGNEAAASLPRIAGAAPSAGRSATVSDATAGGSDYFVARTHSAIAPVGLVVVVPRSVTYLTARGMLSQLVPMTIALVAIVAALAMLTSRRLSRPIERLSRAAEAVGGGDFAVKVDVDTRDEVAQLAGSFNAMAGNLREREERLRAANAQLLQSEKMAAVGQLSAGLAHEVKNPLAGILGFAQLTRRSLQDPAAISKNLDVIERETRRCTEIIGNLMRFSRQEPSERAVVDVNQPVSQAIALVDHQLGLKKVRIKAQLADGLPPVMCNANQLQQVVMNLLINAQQAMEPEGGTVAVQTRAEDGRVVIELDDSGPGIPQEIRSRIFEPFFTTKKAGQGTGLGLSVTYGIVSDHGGNIRVAEAPGGGARFTILLPAHATAGSADGTTDMESKVA